MQILTKRFQMMDALGLKIKAIRTEQFLVPK